VVGAAICVRFGGGVAVVGGLAWGLYIGVSMNAKKSSSPVEIELTRTSQARGEKLKAAIQGQTHLDLYVNVCPVGGEFVVNVGTLAKGATKAKLNEMVMDLLASIVARA
jgi:hypothetical protein